MPNDGLPISSLRFAVDDTQVIESERRLETSLDVIMGRVSDRSSRMARAAIFNAFGDALERLNYDQFAPEFRDKLLENLAKLPIQVNVTGNVGEIDVDLEQLGNKSDLEKAFHRHAVLKGGGKLLAPYAGQELAVEDADVRHEFFEAMLHGEVFQGRDGRLIPTAGLWDRTKKEYLEIWGDKSPQWLYLEFGQSRFEPRIPAFGIIEQMNEDFDSIVQYVFEDEINSALAFEQQGRTTQLASGRTITQSPTGGVTIRGHFYPGGQFIGPLAGFK